jgi:hypothetical protein
MDISETLCKIGYEPNFLPKNKKIKDISSSRDNLHKATEIRYIVNIIENFHLYNTFRGWERVEMSFKRT